MMDAKVSEAEDRRYQEFGTLIRSVTNNLGGLGFWYGPTDDKYRNGCRHPLYTHITLLIPATAYVLWMRSSTVKIELFGGASKTYPNACMYVFCKLERCISGRGGCLVRITATMTGSGYNDERNTMRKLKLS